MKEIWFWISKDISELIIIIATVLVIYMFYGFLYFVHKIITRNDKKIKK